MNSINHVQATELLRTALDNHQASFRDGQWEAIDALVNHKQKLLVVQRTGWGKSVVYFMTTRIFRDWDMGPVIIVSPLLALMRNQIEFANRLKIKAVTINSTNGNDWQRVIQQILHDQIDCLLISPERLSNDNFVKNVLEPISTRLALLVIDEAHCISDWGHDFRPDYCRIIHILRRLPVNISVLGTTATANKRVIADIKAQLGGIDIHRGSLIRQSLALQNIVLHDQASRLAWLAQTIPGISGTGIIYTLTTRDTEKVASWLNQNGITARAYYGDVRDPEFVNSNDYRQHLEGMLLRNELKVLVATSALGMGYDKPDLSFVIHYQAPGSIVTYYQQVGRAGRSIDNAIGVLLFGKEDEAIHRYFRRSPFPTQDQIDKLLKGLPQHDGLKLREIESYTNLRCGQIKKVLKMLSIETPAPVITEYSRWRRTDRPLSIDHERIIHLTQQREQEWSDVKKYINSTSCLMQYLCHALDDNDQSTCGKCASCLGKPIIDTHIDPSIINQAAKFLKHAYIPLTLNKQVASKAFTEYKFVGNLPTRLQAQEGRILSHWGDAGWGRMVEDDKRREYFRDELVDAVTEMIYKRWKPEPFPTWICYVPSLDHPELVRSFAERLATKLRLPLINVVRKVRKNEPQKQQQNRFHQCRNLDGIFAVNRISTKGSVFLIDDIVDSGWTLTVIAALLLQKGSGPVYPIALASTSAKD